jgi:tetratricopeptide (TPR) repeat protein
MAQASAIHCGILRRSKPLQRSCANGRDIGEHVNFLFSAIRQPQRRPILDAAGDGPSERKVRKRAQCPLFAFGFWLAAGTAVWAQATIPGKGPASATPGPSTSVATACDKVSLPGKARLGKAHLDAGNFERAIALFEAAASEPTVPEPVLSCVDQLFREALAGRERTSLVPVSNASRTAGCDKVILPAKARLAETSLKAENFDRAISLLESVGSEPNVSGLALACVAELLGEALIGRERSTSFSARFSKLATENAPGIIWVLGLVLTAIVFYNLRKMYLNRKLAPWRFRRFEDSTGLGIADDLGQKLAGVAKRPESESQSAGLLNLPAVTIPTATVATELNVAISWSDLLTEGPSVQGISSKWIGQLLDGIGRVFTLQSPTISGWARLEGDKILVRLTAQKVGSPPRTVFRESASKTRDDVMAAIEEVAMSMHYLLAEPPGGRSLEDTVRLRKGVTALNEHIRAQGFLPLQEAATAFERVRRQSPDDLEATLYEGLARELLEEHERAFNLFNEVRKLATDVTLRSRAAYNAAVSQLRSYTPESLDRAENILRGLINAPDTPSAIRLFASATLANTIAHKLIFWKQYAGAKPNNPALVPKWQEKAKTQVNSWAEEVDRTLDPLNREAADGTILTVKEKLQLRWLCENARGNCCLYLANYQSHPESGSGVRPNQIALTFAESERHFRTCEQLLPAGVETYTNLATVLLRQQKYPAAIEYAQKARALNPRYEYAYYREAEAIRQASGDDACHTFLAIETKLLNMIRIPAFKKMFEDLHVRIPGT